MIEVAGGVTRRRALGGALAAAGGLALAACTSDSSSSTPGTSLPAVSTRGEIIGGGALVPETLPLSPGAATLGQGELTFLADEQMNFQALLAFGASGVSAEFGEVVTAVNQANAAPGGLSYQSFCDAFNAMGNQVVGWATEAANKGRNETARAQFLRAAQYYSQSLFFVLGTSAPDMEEQVYTTMAAAFANAAARMTPAWERVSIPYEGTSLPGWFLPVGGTSPRPTMILNNGSDGQGVDLVTYCGAAGLERGYNSLILEGPGQAEMLFVRKVPFRYDWEKVITPVVDYLIGRPDVDSSKIGLFGISMGGYMVSRAAAFEQRLAAVVAAPGVESIPESFPAELMELGQAGDQATVNQIWQDEVIAGANSTERFTLAKRLEIFSTEALEQARRGEVPSDWYALSRTISEFDNTSVLSQVEMPFLVTDYDREVFYPGQPQAVFDAIASPDKRLITFTTAEGAQYHDSPMAPQRHNEVVFDWLDDTLGL